ncbi:MAG: hypothetical protein ACWGMT_06040 [Burkholderiales bacterium]
MSSRPTKGQKLTRRKHGEATIPALAANPRLSAQTRKILQKHYRTKYGVRSRGSR